MSAEFNTVRDALAFLERLGSSAAIADEFERRGIRSVPGCPESCAVADFIRVGVGAFSVTVDGDDALVEFVDDTCFDTGCERRELPQCAHEFVVDFDCGKYPNLVSQYPMGAESLFEIVDAA